MYKGVVNSPETTITNDINNTDTLIYVLDETRIPELPNIMVLGSGASAETIKVLSIEDNALSVERGFQGVAKSWNAGTIIARNFTEYDYNALKENIEENDTNIGNVNDDLVAHKADIVPRVTSLEEKIGIVHNVESWQEVQDIVRAGLADQVFSVGDMLVSKYNGKEEIWNVIGIDHDTPTDTNMVYSMTIQSQDCLLNVQFDAPEPSNPDANRQQYGNNRYIHSAIKQWLNSNEDTFNWVSQHEYDVAPTSPNYEGAGFLKLLDPELVAVIGAVDKQVAKATVDGGGQDLFSDKVFLLSRTEVYGTAEGAVTGEKVYPFYSALAPSVTNGELAGRIKLLGSSPRHWWSRSPYPGYSHYPRYVTTSGHVSNNYANYALGVSPACVII